MVGRRLLLGAGTGAIGDGQQKREGATFLGTSSLCVAPARSPFVTGLGSHSDSRPLSTATTSSEAVSSDTCQSPAIIPHRDQLLW